MRKFLAERPLVLVALIIVTALMTVWGLRQWQTHIYYECEASSGTNDYQCAAQAFWAPRPV